MNDILFKYCRPCGVSGFFTCCVLVSLGLILSYIHQQTLLITKYTIKFVGSTSAAQFLLLFCCRECGLVLGYGCSLCIVAYRSGMLFTCYILMKKHFSESFGKAEALLLYQSFKASVSN